MPGRDRRREEDLRAPRFESEMRTSDFAKLKTNDLGTIQARIYSCSNCNKPFAEKSRYCPRCDTKTMGELRPHNEREAAKYKEQSIRRLQAKHGR